MNNITYGNLRGSVLILNGAPMTGKDEIANFLASESYLVEHLSFKDKLFEVAACLANMDYFDLKQLNERETKDVYCEALGMSPRAWLIYVSEVVVKPHLGKDFFGKALAKTISKETKDGKLKWFSVVSDGGFIEEIEAVAKEVGGSNIIVARLHREGYTFTTDSRKHLSKEQLELLGVKSFDYYNTAFSVDDMVRDFKDKLFDFFKKNC